MGKTELLFSFHVLFLLALGSNKIQASETGLTFTPQYSEDRESLKLDGIIYS